MGDPDRAVVPLSATPQLLRKQQRSLLGRLAPDTLLSPRRKPAVRGFGADLASRALSDLAVQLLLATVHA